MKKGIVLLSTVLFLLSFIAYADVGDVEDAGDAVKDEAAAPAAEGAAEEVKAEEAAPAVEAEAPAAKEEAKAEEAAEAPKAEEVKVEEVKVEEAAAEKPAVEEKKVEEPKAEVVAEAPKVEEKVAEKPVEEVKVEEAKPVEVVAEAPKVEEAKPAEAAKPAPAEAPKKQEAAAAAPEENKPAEECCGSTMGNIGMALLYYIPNRILDLNDSITMDIGVGSESGVEFGITKYFQFGGMYGDKYFLMKGYKGQYGGAYSGGWDGQLLKPGWNYSMACLADESRVIEDSFGTVKKYIKRKSGLAMCDISQEAYKKGARDFWEMDVKAGWVVTFGLQIHPVDMADFMCGLFLIDFKGNDLK